MKIKEFQNLVRKHYLLIEQEFITTTNFVALHEKNYKTFSDKYFSICMLIGSEIDVIM